MFFLLQLAARGFLSQQTDTIMLYMETGITGLGKTQIDFLYQHYLNVFKMLDVKIVENKTENTITAEGYSLYDLFKAEEGIYLFYGIQQTLVPIKLFIRKKEEKLAIHRILKVVRVYNQEATLTDVRTGFANAIKITPQEFKLLLFAGVEKKFRG